ncbi:TlpA family protein disulfide reductase [Aquimarina sp. 2-A2]|uniref:TlpA family protein disulfide reductase n=1 Tax=Aquimarina sp. 2-A2 TaxID=3382644 RepID=UPI00387F006D
MKKLIFILLLFNSLASYSQTKYYTTNGKNRLTEAEIKEKVSEREIEIEKTYGQKLFASLTIDETETKKDSIISKVIFKFTKERQNKLFNYGPLSEFKNKEFPKFNLNTLTYGKIDLEKLKGKPTLINFWYMKCAPCIEEMPVLNKIKEKYKNDCNFVAITYEKKEDVAKFLKKYTFNFKHLIDSKGFIDELGVKEYPMNLFLDKNGILRYVKGGIPYESKKGEEPKMSDGTEFIEIIKKLK